MNRPIYKIGDKVEIRRNYHDDNCPPEKLEYNEYVGKITHIFYHKKKRKNDEEYYLYDVTFYDGKTWCYESKDFRKAKE